MLDSNYQQDQKYLNLAINLAKKSLHKCSPNPRVGCVIVKNNVILSTAITAINGRPHSEIIAIEKVKDKSLLIDASIYLTLEPCCFYHGKKSAGCVDQIIAHKFKKVVIANIDCNPNINGRSVEILRKSGVEVVIIESAEGKKLHQDFFKIQKYALPYVTLKIASSLDGKIATRNFSSQWITNEQSRKYSHLLRAQSDAILIGANTLRHDNPSLTCRIKGLEEYSPQKIIVSSSLDFNKNYKIFDDCSNVIIITGESNLNHPALENFAGKVVFVKKSSTDNQNIDLRSALRLLLELGINTILVEGGSKIIAQLIQDNLVDKIIWAKSQIIIGNDGIPAIAELGIDDIKNAINNFELQEVIRFEDNLIEILQKI